MNFILSCAVRGRAADQAERTQELDRALIQQLRERCEQQNLQLQILQAQFKKASMCLDVFSITTQHFCQKVGSSGKQTANFNSFLLTIVSPRMLLHTPSAANITQSRRREQLTNVGESKKQIIQCHFQSKLDNLEIEVWFK